MHSINIFDGFLSYGDDSPLKLVFYAKLYATWWLLRANFCHSNNIWNVRRVRCCCSFLLLSLLNHKCILNTCHSYNHIHWSALFIRAGYEKMPSFNHEPDFAYDDECKVYLKFKDRIDAVTTVLNLFIVCVCLFFCWFALLIWHNGFCGQYHKSPSHKLLQIISMRLFFQHQNRRIN